MSRFCVKLDSKLTMPVGSVWPVSETKMCKTSADPAEATLIVLLSNKLLPVSGGCPVPDALTKNDPMPEPATLASPPPDATVVIGLPAVLDRGRPRLR